MEFVSWDDEIPHFFWEHGKCSKPPPRINCYVQFISVPSKMAKSCVA